MRRLLDALGAELLVVAGRRVGHKRHAQRIRAVGVHHLHEVHHVALRLAHLLALFVPNHAVQIYGMEWYLAHVLQPLEDHARHPEEEDVVPRLHYIAGVEVVEVGRFFRPAKRAARPQSRREPCIEYILVLPNTLATALLTLGHLLRLPIGSKAMVILAIPHRHAVAPPQLPRYGPVAYILHPVEIHLCKTFRHYLD